MAKIDMFIAAIFLWTTALAATCPKKEDSVSDLKNFNPKYKYPWMYSGFVNVDQTTNSNLFYWFYRSDNLEPEAPLVLWLNGGPGSSSQLGNFIENGPLRLVKDDSGIIRVHSITDQAWTAVANVIFLDQPVGVGYSYGQMNITTVKAFVVTPSWNVRNFGHLFLRWFLLLSS